MLDCDDIDEILYRNRSIVKRLVKDKKKGLKLAEKIGVPFARLQSYKKIIFNDIKHKRPNVEVYTDYKEFRFRTSDQLANPVGYKNMPIAEFLDLTNRYQVQQVLDEAKKRKDHKPIRLTLNQELFVTHYLSCRSVAKAAERAGYSTNTASDSGNKIMNNPKVRDAIAQRLAMPLDRFNLTPEKIIEDLVVMRDRAMQSHPVKDTNGRFLGEWTYDPKTALKAVELMGKYLKMFSDRIEHTGLNGGPIQHQVKVDFDFSELSDEELKYFQERIRPKLKVIEMPKE